MKKTNILIAAFAAVLSFSCSDDIFTSEQDSGNQQQELVPMTLSTTVELTKTFLSGTQVHWNEDDVIAVFDDLNCSNMFEAVEVNGHETVFEGLVNARTTDVYAVYPYSEEVRATSEAIHVKLDDDQTPVSGTFAEECNISVAHSVKDASADVVEDVVFKNVCGLIKFTVPERFSNITSVSLTTDRNIAGDLLVRKSDMGVEVEGNGSRTVSMTGSFATGSTFYFVVTPGEIKELSLRLILDGSIEYSKVMPASAAFTLEAGKIKNLGNIDFTPVPTAVAEHTYDADGVLTGTKVTLNLGLPAGLEKCVENLNATMSQNGSEYRRIMNSAGEASVEMETIYGSTYLRQGDYSVRYTYSFNGKEESNTLTVKVPAPTFKVSTSAYTSYTEYLKGTDVSIMAANSCNAETIYDIRCSVGIDEKLLNGPIYSLTSCDVILTSPSGSNVAVAGTFNDSDDLCFTHAQQTVSEWGAYTLTAKVTFDGVTVTAQPQTLHITGLPYRSPDFLSSQVSMQSTSSAGVKDWVAEGNVEYWSGHGYRLVYYYLGGVSAGNVFSPAFQVPDNTRISYQCPVCYFSTGLGNPTMTVYTGVTGNYTEVTTASTNVKRINSNMNPGINQFTTVSKDDTMMRNGRISISTDGQKDGNAAENWFTVGSLTVNYRK